MAGSAIDANMGLQRSHRPTGLLPQGVSATAEVNDHETLQTVPPYLVVNSFGRTVVQQDGFDSSALVEQEYQGGGEDKKKWRFFGEYGSGKPI